MTTKHGYFEKSDKELVDHLVDSFGARTQAPALAELHRRQILAIVDFNAKASRQANKMIALTWAIAVLTVVLAVLAGVQAWAMLRS